MVAIELFDTSSFLATGIFTHKSSQSTSLQPRDCSLGDGLSVWGTGTAQTVERLQPSDRRTALPATWTLPALCRQLQLAEAAVDQHLLLTAGTLPLS